MMQAVLPGLVQNWYHGSIERLLQLCLAIISDSLTLLASVDGSLLLQSLQWLSP